MFSNLSLPFHFLPMVEEEEDLDLVQGRWELMLPGQYFRAGPLMGYLDKGARQVSAEIRLHKWSLFVALPSPRLVRALLRLRRMQRRSLS